jgi:putative two-component system response regulator
MKPESLGPPVRLVAALTELRDPETGKHQQRVARYTRIIADCLGLTTGYVETLEMLAVAHDVGKISISDVILRKPGVLTAAEMDVMREHVSSGLGVIDTMLAELGLQNSDYKRALMLREIIRSHHERWDGSGYPDGLVGATIPYAARVVAVADVWDAVTQFRAYRPLWSPARARAHIVGASGKHFDPVVAKAFTKAFPEIVFSFNQFKDTTHRVD